MGRNERKTGRCPKCCPDGGAFFSAGYSEDNKPVWICSNCSTEVLRRTNSRQSVKPTATQQRVLDHIKARFAQGKAVVKSQEMIGRAVFFCMRDESVLAGDFFILTIGPLGKVKGTHYYFGGYREVTDYRQLY